MDAIISVDDSQRILIFNPAAERMFRCPAAEAIGQPLERFMPERFRDAHADHVREFGETRQTTRAMGHPWDRLRAAHRRRGIPGRGIHFAGGRERAADLHRDHARHYGAADPRG
jgi:PAS domain-containing protein